MSTIMESEKKKFNDATDPQSDSKLSKPGCLEDPKVADEEYTVVADKQYIVVAESPRYMTRLTMPKNRFRKFCFSLYPLVWRVNYVFEDGVYYFLISDEKIRLLENV